MLKEELNAVHEVWNLTKLIRHKSDRLNSLTKRWNKKSRKKSTVIIISIGYQKVKRVVIYRTPIQWQFIPFFVSLREIIAGIHRNH